MPNKQQSMQHILALMMDANISVEEIALALKPKQDSLGKSSIVMKLLAYLGGVFVLGGIVAFISMFWEGLNPLFHTLITLGVGFISFLSAILALKNERFQMIVLPLFIIAAILQCLGLFVYFDEYFGGGNHWQLGALFVFATLIIQNICTFFGTDRNELLFLTLVFATGFGFVGLNWLLINPDHVIAIVGLSLILSVLFIERTQFKEITPFWFLISSILLLVGVFECVENSSAEFLFLIVASFLVYESVKVKSKILLTVSIISIFIYIGYFTTKHFVATIGWPIALIGLGLLLFGLSALAFRINKKYITT